MTAINENMFDNYEQMKDEKYNGFWYTFSNDDNLYMAIDYQDAKETVLDELLYSVEPKTGFIHLIENGKTVNVWVFEDIDAFYKVNIDNETKATFKTFEDAIEYAYFLADKRINKSIDIIDFYDDIIVKF